MGYRPVCGCDGRSIRRARCEPVTDGETGTGRGHGLNEINCAIRRGLPIACCGGARMWRATLEGSELVGEDFARRICGKPCCAGRIWTGCKRRKRTGSADAQGAQTGLGADSGKRIGDANWTAEAGRREFGSRDDVRVKLQARDLLRAELCHSFRRTGFTGRKTRRSRLRGFDGADGFFLGENDGQ